MDCLQQAPALFLHAKNNKKKKKETGKGKREKTLLKKRIQ